MVAVAPIYKAAVIMIKGVGGDTCHATFLK